MVDGGSALPGWPRALREPLAAAYVGLSGTTFRQVVMPEVPFIKLSHSRVAWLREDLDAWLDGLKGDRRNRVDGINGDGDGAAPEEFNATAALAAARAALPPKRGTRRPRQTG